jgi:hypothetical protein
MTNDCTKYTYSSRRDLQKLRHALLAPGQFPGLTGQMTGRLAAPVTKPTTTDVPLASRRRGITS